MLLLNQFHDILPGSSIGEVYQDSEAQFEKIFTDTRGVVNSVLDTLARNTASEVYLCDLNENDLQSLPLNGNQVSFTIKPFEIVTIKIK